MKIQILSYFISIVLLAMGLIFLFIPFSTEEYIVKRENGIMRDGPDYLYDYNYPDRSYDQRININLLSNESLNIYIMNSSTFSFLNLYFCDTKNIAKIIPIIKGINPCIT